MLTFTHTSGTWTPSRNPTRPGHAPKFQQAAANSGAVLYGYDPVTVIDAVTYSWPHLPDSDVVTLSAFFTAVDGMVGQFTVTDLDGSTFTASFATPRIDIFDTVYGSKQVSLSIRREL